MEQKVGDAHMLAAGTNRRNYQMDNLKCLLIFSVVFGHMLELFMGEKFTGKSDLSGDLFFSHAPFCFCVRCFCAV